MERHFEPRGRHHHSRGAIFVEALIVICTFSLLMLGMVFFRTLYLKQMRTARLARASVMAYSMGGCDRGGPVGWAGQDITASITPSNSVNNSTGRSDPLNPAPTSANANSMLTKIPGAPTSGNALFPVAQMGLQTTADATTSDGPLRPRRGFQHTTGSTSYVVCGEEMKDGDIMDLVGFALNLIGVKL